MKRSLSQRLIQAVIVLTGVVLLTFVMLRIIPGNPDVMGTVRDH